MPITKTTVADDTIRLNISVTKENDTITLRLKIRSTNQVGAGRPLAITQLAALNAAQFLIAAEIDALKELLNQNPLALLQQDRDLMNG